MAESGALSGRVALVTGSGAGMGRAHAILMAERGADIVVQDIESATANDTAAEVKKRGRRALAFAHDIADIAASRAMVQKAEAALGRIDIVVNNTGGPPAGSFEDFDDDAWRTAWDLTLMSTLRLTRLALPELRKSGRGRVVNITSSAVKEPSEGLLLSNTYRPGVIGWAKTLSQDEGPHGITVNSIAPGYIDTERMKSLYAGGADPDGDRRRDEGLIPARRFGDPGEIGDLCAFLCSTRAAYLNGITILVDGGLAKGLLS